MAEGLVAYGVKFLLGTALFLGLLVSTGGRDAGCELFSYPMPEGLMATFHKRTRIESWLTLI